MYKESADAECWTTIRMDRDHDDEGDGNDDDDQSYNSSRDDDDISINRSKLQDNRLRWSRYSVQRKTKPLLKSAPE